MTDFEDDKVVRCFSCGTWVRSVATELVPTGERDDMERWCNGCINTVDANTRNLLMPGYTPAPLELEEGT